MINADWISRSQLAKKARYARVGWKKKEVVLISDVYKAPTVNAPEPKALLPCPFCGGEARTWQSEGELVGARTIEYVDSVLCKSCMATMAQHIRMSIEDGRPVVIGGDHNELIDRWNGVASAIEARGRLIKGCVDDGL